MLLDWERYGFYVRPGKTDMRKKATTLSILIENEMEMSPFEKNVYLFCSKSKRILKAIVWDGNGFWELSKRLETAGTFSWPMSREEAQAVTLEDIRLLLKGADPWRTLPRETPQKAS